MFFNVGKLVIYYAKIAGGVETTSSSTKNKNTLKKGKFCLIRFTKSGERTAMRRIQAKRDWCIISPYSVTTESKSKVVRIRQVITNFRNS